MPWGLKRYQQSKRSHFRSLGFARDFGSGLRRPLNASTFSCYRRLPHLDDERLRDLFVECLERTRRSYGLRVYGYVVMPEHVHLLVSEPERETLAKAIQALKISVARRAMTFRAERELTLWQKRYYDHNVRSHESFVVKLRYIHRSPVQRGLVGKPEDWKWGSFRHYATAEEGPVEIESQWTADGGTEERRNYCGLARHESKSKDPHLPKPADVGHRREEGRDMGPQPGQSC